MELRNIKNKPAEIDKSQDPKGIEDLEGAVLSTLKNILEGGTNINEKQVNQLIAMLGTLPDFALKLFNANFGQIRTVLNNDVSNLNQEKQDEISNIEEKKDDQETKNDSITIWDLIVKEFLEAGQEAISIEDLFTIKEDNEISVIEDWLTKVKDAAFIAIHNKQGGKQYYAFSDIEENINNIDAGEEKKANNMLDILAQLSMASNLNKVVFNEVKAVISGQESKENIAEIKKNMPDKNTEKESWAKKVGGSQVGKNLPQIMEQENIRSGNRKSGGRG